jgi:hypothetical protein
MSSLSCGQPGELGDVLRDRFPQNSPKWFRSIKFKCGCTLVAFSTKSEEDATEVLMSEVANLKTCAKGHPLE